jgi:hypothetical protein
MSGLGFGTGINADDQAKIDAKWLADKKGKGKAAAPPPDPNAPIDMSKIPGARFAAAPPAPKTLKLDADTRKKLAAAKPEAAADKEAKRKASLLRIHENYYHRKETAPYLPKKVALSMSSSVQQISDALAAVRCSLNAANAADNIRRTFPTIVAILIKALQAAGALEMLQLTNLEPSDAKALGMAMQQQAMQTEATEMEIELEDWFASSWHIRLAVKTYMFLQALSVSKGARGKPAGAFSPASASALFGDGGDEK